MPGGALTVARHTSQPQKCGIFFFSHDRRAVPLVVSGRGWEDPATERLRTRSLRVGVDNCPNWVARPHERAVGTGTDAHALVLSQSEAPARALCGGRCSAVSSAGTRLPRATQPLARTPRTRRNTRLLQMAKTAANTSRGESTIAVMSGVATEDGTEWTGKAQAATVGREGRVLALVAGSQDGRIGLWCRGFVLTLPTNKSGFFGLGGRLVARDSHSSPALPGLTNFHFLPALPSTHPTLRVCISSRLFITRIL